ncbi:GNAT family N-acetyltransferase [Janthinobacterium sp. Mn2066]|uniref:GNAT family N-acetyltransferase n=1 Tax=Janthinobacterium sp. Mn2066 TaxID=3395264 RepID=UPI003BD96434
MHESPPEAALLITERLILKRPSMDDAASLLAFRIATREHLQAWEPARSAAFYTLAAVESQLRGMLLQIEHQSAVYWQLHVRQEQGESKIIGACSFTNIVRGPFQACYLGFSLASEYEGQGLMQEALQAAIADIFNRHGLHRIMANYQPHNQRSGQLLSRLGFEREGLARAYLHINGAWADHILTSLIHPRPAGAP